MKNLLLLSDEVKKGMEVDTYSMIVMDALAAHMLNVREDIASWQTSTLDDYEDGLIFISRVGLDDDEDEFVTITSIAQISEATSSINYIPAVGDFHTEDDDEDDWGDTLDGWVDDIEIE